MSDERPEYSQGVCADGAAILEDGVMLTIDEIVSTLNNQAETARCQQIVLDQISQALGLETGDVEGIGAAIERLKHWAAKMEEMAGAEIEKNQRLNAQLAEAKTLFITERTEGVYPYEDRQEEEADAEKYFDRMMELTAKQAAELAQQAQREG